MGNLAVECYSNMIMRDPMSASKRRRPSIAWGLNEFVPRKVKNLKYNNIQGFTIEIRDFTPKIKGNFQEGLVLPEECL